MNLIKSNVYGGKTCSHCGKEMLEYQECGDDMGILNWFFDLFD
ncbi:hypothetical protein ACQY1Q_07120 [Tenacibaculum sp. TC6]